MKIRCHTYIFAMSILAAGCCSTKSPYDYLDNWIIREDSSPSFLVTADIIYLPDELYVDMKELDNVKRRTKSEVGNGKFDGIARVFSPLVATPGDLEKALDWYFGRQHEKGRPFVFMGKGTGGGLLKDYEEANGDVLRKTGLVASYYTEKSGPDFVNDEMVEEIKDVFMRVKYRQQWNRDMSEGIQGK